MSPKVKNRTLPLAMLVGSIAGYLFPEFIKTYATLFAPILIFAMLLITYCRISFREIRITGMHWKLIAVQIFGSLALFFMLYPLSPDIAEGTFICVFCPTATAAPVITGMLGGSITTLVAYSLLSNITVALLAPFIFSFMGVHAEISFLESLVIIGEKVVPLLILPLLCAIALQYALPKAHSFLSSRQSLSFYLWAVSLFLVIGKAVTFIIEQGSEYVLLEVAIAGCALAVCLMQFKVGRLIGKRYGDKVSGGQGLGQKNTVLAIWMALTYLNPVASVGPAAYVVWQNIINSWQLWRKDQKK